MKLPPDVEQYVRSSFSPDDVEEAIHALERAKLHNGSEAEPRFLRCAVIASGKTRKGLVRQVEELAYDYRDVILRAQYVRKKGEWVRIRDLSKPLATHL